MRKCLIFHLMAILLLILLPGHAAADPAVTVDPVYAQRQFHNLSDKEKIRIHIKLSGAVNLLTYGIRVTYEPSKLEVLEFHKNEAVWDMGGTGYFKDHELYMFGASSTPVNGEALLGWIVVEHQGGINNTPATGHITVQLARDSAEEPYFDNFVKFSEEPEGRLVDSSVDFSGAQATICIPQHYDVAACQGDFDGDSVVDQADYERFYDAYPSVFSADASYDPAADLDADGDVDDDDKALFDEDYGRTIPCPVCGGYEIESFYDEIGGAINPEGHISVAEQADYTFQILPDPNYSVSSVVVDGEEALSSCTKDGADYTYTFTDVTADHTIDAHFCHLPGDIDGSGFVNYYDYYLFRTAFGGSEGSPNWNPRADLDGSTMVNYFDYYLFRQNFGNTCP